MSKIIDSFFKTTEKPEMGRSGKVIYTLLGLIGTAFLITAYYTKNQLLHQIGASAGILGMVAVAAATRIRKIGWKEYMLIWLRRDIAIGYFCYAFGSRTQRHKAAARTLI